jgi:hypothetical protein
MLSAIQRIKEGIIHMIYVYIYHINHTYSYLRSRTVSFLLICIARMSHVYWQMCEKYCTI